MFPAPSSGGEDIDTQMPVCIAVEFDDIKFGDEEVDELDEEGRRKIRPRIFFPELNLGVDAGGKERSRKCVPMFRMKANSASDDDVYRKQIPLTLAWALTHWKAQGMTLKKARVRLSAKTARQAGIGFVSITRVKHPRHLVFDDDLPLYTDFQEAQYTAGFRQRRRFELRLHALASGTLRRYGFCKADTWSEDCCLATALLQGLEVVARDRARALDVRGDADAWLWPGETPGVENLMEEQVARLARDDASTRVAAQRVAERLLGPLHRARMEEVLGCLIPPELHPRWDGKRPKGKSTR